METNDRFNKLWRLMKKHRFQSDWNECWYNNLNCTSCFNLLINPFISDCGCLFCEMCIRKYLDNESKPCSMHKNKILEIGVTVRPDLKIKYTLARLMEQCPISLCFARLPLNKIENHIENCTVKEIDDNKITKSNNKQSFLKVIHSFMVTIKTMMSLANCCKYYLRKYNKILQILTVSQKKNKEEMIKLKEDFVKNKFKRLNLMKQLKEITTPLKHTAKGFINQNKAVQKCQRRVKMNAKDIIELSRIRRRMKVIKKRREKFNDDIDKEVMNMELCIQPHIDGQNAIIKQLENNNSIYKNNKSLMIAEREKSLNEIKLNLMKVKERIFDVKMKIEKVEGKVPVAQGAADMLWLVGRTRELILNSAHDFIWKIDTFYDIGRYCRSDSFYASNYRLQLKMSAIWESYHLSFKLLKGDFDDCVEWPMRHTVILSIVHHDSFNTYFSKSFSIVTESSNVGFRREDISLNNYVGWSLATFTEISRIQGLLHNGSIMISCSLYSPLQTKDS